MTYQEKAEQYVREKLPELMELSFGCRFLDEEDAIEYTVVERNDIYDKYGVGKNEVWSIPNFNKGYQADWRFDSLGCGLKIIGHPIQLQHWLRVLEEKDCYADMIGNIGELTAINPNTDDMVVFNLTTGQPASEADYQAFCEIVGIK